jgi:hypothetical protein
MKLIRALDRPWHVRSPLPIWLFLVITVLAAKNVAFLIATPVNPDLPIDFRPLYMGQILLLAGENPYDDDLIKQEWKALARREGFESGEPPGYPKTLLLYPPWALPLLTGFSVMSWMTARAVWWAAIPLFVVGIAWFVGRGSPPGQGIVPFVDVLLLALAFKATDWAYYVGQPMFLCLLFGFASLDLGRRNRWVAEGLTLGLACFKITLGIPFVLQTLYRRRWRALAVAVLVGAALSSVFLLLNPDPAAAAQSYRSNVERLRDLVFSSSNEGYPIAFKMVSRTELAVVAELLVPGWGRFDRWVNLSPLLVLLPFWIGPLRSRRVSEVRAFCFFSAVSLLCTHHLHYDCLVLLPLYLLALEVDRVERLAILAAGAFFLVPINGILSLVDLPPSLNILMYNVQIGLVVLLIVLTWGLTRGSRSEPALVG